MCKPIALTFSKKNEDVYNLIQNRDKTKYKTTTEYIAECIRAFESQKVIDEENRPVNRYETEYIINSALAKLKAELINSNVSFGTGVTQEEKIVTSLESLEENLDDDILNCDED